MIVLGDYLPKHHQAHPSAPPPARSNLPEAADIPILQEKSERDRHEGSIDACN